MVRKQLPSGFGLLVGFNSPVGRLLSRYTGHLICFTNGETRSITGIMWDRNLCYFPWNPTSGCQKGVLPIIHLFRGVLGWRSQCQNARQTWLSN